MSVTKLHIKNYNNSSESDTINKYQSVWETRSSIRTRPRKIIDFSQAGYFFPEAKQPMLLDKEVQNLGEEVKEEILLQSFRKYLNDIVTLEIKLINAACNNIIYNKDLVVKYSDEMKLNAYTIIIDEYYHVYIAQDMLFQIYNKFPDLRDFNYPSSDSYNAVVLTKKKLDEKYHDIFDILAVCIFETTLVRELIEFFNTSNIHPSIKYYINDHMNDESRHYNYFYNLLCYTWTKLPEEYQNAIGVHLAEFICLYLNIKSDKAFFKDLLCSFLEDKDRSIKIIDDLYKGFKITPEIPIVKNVIKVMTTSGIFKNKSVRDSFQFIGWE